MALFGGPLPCRTTGPSALSRRGLSGDTGAMAAPSDTGYPLGWPVHPEFFPNGQGLPASIHGIQGRTRWSRGTRPPRSHVSVHEMFGGIERLMVHTDELPAWLRAAAPDDALEGRPLAGNPQNPCCRPRIASTTNWARS